MKPELPPLFRPNLDIVQESLMHHHEIFKTRNYPKRLLNYMNYSKKDYDIITLQTPTPIYTMYSKHLTQYGRETPNWNDSDYKKKKIIKPNPYNSFIIRNISTLKNPLHKQNRSTIQRSDIYSVKSNDKSPYSTQTKPRISSSKKSVRSFSLSESKAETKSIKMLTKKEREVKRFQNLLKYITSLGKDSQERLLEMLSLKLKAKKEENNKSTAPLPDAPLNEEEVKDQDTKIKEATEDAGNDKKEDEKGDINESNDADIKQKIADIFMELMNEGKEISNKIVKM